MTPDSARCRSLKMGLINQIAPQPLIGEGPEDRPEQQALAAQHHHHQDLQGHLEPEGVVRLHIAVLKEVQGADQPREEGRQSMKALVLSQGAFTPMTMAVSSSSRMAMSPRPKRECFTR